MFTGRNIKTGLVAYLTGKEENNTHVYLLLSLNDAPNPSFSRFRSETTRHASEIYCSG
jgi:hypothetical protein